MKLKNVNKRIYSTPRIVSFALQVENLMQAVGSGQHSTIGQGGSAGDAKGTVFFEEEDDSDEQWNSHSIWEE